MTVNHLKQKKKLPILSPHEPSGTTWFYPGVSNITSPTSHFFFPLCYLPLLKGFVVDLRDVLQWILLILPYRLMLVGALCPCPFFREIVFVADGPSERLVPKKPLELSASMHNLSIK